jgi:primary-amine oxidase
VSAAHPLDPLSREEIVAAVALLREAGHSDAATRFALIELDEPLKADVLAWKPAESFTRKAFIVARRDRTVLPYHDRTSLCRLPAVAARKEPDGISRVSSQT